MSPNRPARITLTPQQTQAVNQARRVLVDLVPELDAAEKCGIDCQAQRRKHTELLAGLDNVIKHFGSK